MKKYLLAAAIAGALWWGVGPARAVEQAGTVQLNFDTKAVGGRYAPDNLVAVWVTDSQGAFVRTLLCRGKRYTRSLRAWMESSHGDTTDAVTGATLHTFKKHQVVWDCKNSKGEIVPDGVYRLHIELLDGKTAITPDAHLEITKGPNPAQVRPPDVASFRKITLSYAPGASATAAAGAASAAGARMPPTPGPAHR